MNTEPTSEQKADDVDLRIFPEGTFAGTIEKALFVKEGEVVPDDTGDQGGGQN